MSLCLRSLQIAISPYTAKGTVVNNPTPVAPGVGMYYEHSSIPKSLHALFAPQVRACPCVAPCVCMYVRFPLCFVCISPHVINVSRTSCTPPPRHPPPCPMCSMHLYPWLFAAVCGCLYSPSLSCQPQAPPLTAREVFAAPFHTAVLNLDEPRSDCPMTLPTPTSHREMSRLGPIDGHRPMSGLQVRGRLGAGLGQRTLV